MSTREPGTVAASLRQVRPMRRRRRWPLRWYLAGLLVLFVVTAGAGIYAGWVQARHDAVSAARADAVVAADLASLDVRPKVQRPAG